MTERKGIYFGTISAESTSQDGSAATSLVPASVRRDASRPAASNSLLEAAIRAGNVNTADTGEKEVLQLSESSLAAQEKHAQLLRRIETEKRVRSIVVPTSIEEVVMRLRQLHQPITLFGEGPADRRERLREVLARIELESEEGGVVTKLLGHLAQQQAAAEGGTAASADAKATGKQAKIEDQLFYIPIKSNELKQARASIFSYAAERTQKRLKLERLEKAHGPKELYESDRAAAALYTTMQKTVNVASQNGDVRPLAAVKYSYDAKHIATGSWSGLVKVWDASSATEVKVYRGHQDRITGLAWHPSAAGTFSDMSDTSDAIGLCTGSADGTAKLWSSSSSESRAELKGHKARLGKIAFHPSGNYVGTTSFDHSWRLWDVATAQELLLQEGHYKEVYAIAFHNDGALAATGDLNGIGRVWDLRSGKSIQPLQGHSKQILSVDFAPNGYQIATGSDDRTVRVWDLRHRKCSYTIPAHSNLVSDVQFSPVSGELLLSASFDATVKVWRSRDWKLLATLKGHDGKVTGADFSRDERHIVSCGFDRTFKFWAHESEF